MYDLLLAVRLSVEPTVILVSTKIDDSVIDRFDPENKNRGSVSGDNDQFRLPFLLEVRPPSEFYYDTAKGKILNLRMDNEHGPRVNFHVPGELAAVDRFDKPGPVGQQGQLLRIAGCIDLESRATVGSSFSLSITRSDT